jgi:prevent-host-death family protein
MNTPKAVVRVREARAHLSRLLERAHRGETIVLAKAGKPCAKLVPLETPEPRKPGVLKGKFQLTKAFFELLPEDELRQWERRSGWPLIRLALVEASSLLAFCYR